MAILILQDHSTFFDRMLEQAINHQLGHPLSITAIESIRRRTLVTKYRGQLRTLGMLRDMVETAAPGAESQALSRAIASVVEADIEGWFCIADNDGREWLENHHVGPVLRWGGGVWWGRLKGIAIDTEVKWHDDFKPPSRKRAGSGQRKAETTGLQSPSGGPSSGLRRPDVPPLN